MMAGSAAGADAMPDYEKMAAGMDGAGAGSAAASPLPKSEITDTTPAPSEHVEALFKDLAAVGILNLPQGSGCAR